jgi:hypothetical protein
MTETDATELVDAVATFRKTTDSLAKINRANFPLFKLAELLADVRKELRDGRGMVMLQDFPMEHLDPESVAIAYLGMGSYLGERMMQNSVGHVLGHVTDTGGDYQSGRGYNTRAELRFHSDACDYVGLLCLKTAKMGGDSRVASSVTVYNKLLETRPDLVEVLCCDFYRSHNGEMSPGERPWFKEPVFCFCDGYFSATSAGTKIDKAQGLPGVPPLSPVQWEAVQAYRATVPTCALDIAFAPGDIQFLNNHVMLHSRRGYEDWPERERKRHLLRLWLNDPDGRPVPKSLREGRSGQGIQIAGLEPAVPIYAEAIA